MIRWRYVITRLLIVAVVLFLLSQALGPAAKYVTVRSLESATGAKVEIDDALVGFFPPRVQYLDVQVADPRGDKEMENAFQADSIELTIDGQALLQRRWVASNASISGIQIGADRDSSGHYEPTEDPVTESSGPSILGKLVGGAVDSIGDHASSVVGDLETTRRSKEIRDRWERDYKQLVTQARDLEKHIRDIRDSARSIDNPLRDWAELDRTLARATEARKQLNVVRQAIDSLPERLQSDMASMDEARRIDLAKVNEYVPGNLSESSNFGIDLLSKAVRDQVTRVRQYMDNGRAIANYTVVAPETERVLRGVDHDLWGENRLPNMLVRHCKVDGLMRADGNEYTLSGTLENLSPTPELLDKPSRALLTLEGPDIVFAEFIRDQRNGSDLEKLTIRWPHAKASSMELGNDDDASIKIEGGEHDLWVQIQTEGSQMQGSVISKQRDVRMSLNVDKKYADTPAVASLNRSLSDVDSFEIRANFAGTWGDLDLNLNTSLVKVLQQAAQDAITDQMIATKRQIAKKVEETHLTQTTELRKWLSSRQGEARTLLASADKSIEEMSRKVINEMGSADAYLGKLRTAVEGRLR